VCGIGHGATSNLLWGRGMAIQAGRPGTVNLAEAAASGGAVVPRRSLVDDVYERLIELLLEANLEPGARLQIDAMARAWQVSQDSWISPPSMPFRRTGAVELTTTVGPVPIALGFS